jgi:hypothetical protein
MIARNGPTILVSDIKYAPPPRTIMTHPGFIDFCNAPSTVDNMDVLSGVRVVWEGGLA